MHKRRADPLTLGSVLTTVFFQVKRDLEQKEATDLLLCFVVVSERLNFSF